MLDVYMPFSVNVQKEPNKLRRHISGISALLKAFVGYFELKIYYEKKKKKKKERFFVSFKLPTSKRDTTLLTCL